MTHTPKRKWGLLLGCTLIGAGISVFTKQIWVLPVAMMVGAILNFLYIQKSKPKTI